MLERAVAWFASNGVGETSLRSLAAGIGTSHRMLIYHFGSKEGLLAAVVEDVWRQQQTVLDDLLADAADPLAAAWSFWDQLADANDVFAPLFFELSASAMQGHAWAASLRTWMSVWNDTLARLFRGLGHPPQRADVLGRTALAVTRGTLFELALTGDRAAADETVRAFLESTRRPG
nr:TetR/AcrR family transcriptional regulator [Auraticoccus cholistanensis]